MLEFFKQVLPTNGGLYILGSQRVGQTTGAFDQTVCSSLEELVTLAYSTDRDPTRNVYFAVSSFKQGWHPSGKVDPKTGRIKQHVRTQENSAFKRCFYLDLDVDPEKPIKYKDKHEAIQGLIRIVKEVLHVQPLLVETKNGYHCYWPLTEDVPTSEWQPVANAFKYKLLGMGIKFDVAVPADAARVLRPIETTHRKTADHVRIFQKMPAERAMTLQEFADCVDAITEKPPLEYPSILTELGMGPVTMAPAYGEVAKPLASTIVANCKQLRDAGGFDYAGWFAAICLLTMCEGGKEAAHEISKGDSRYTPETTDAQFDVATSGTHGPTLCSTFDEHNPGGCAGCPFAGEIKSPYHLKVVEAPKEVGVPPFVLEALSSKRLKGYTVNFSGDKFGTYAKVQEVTPDGEIKKAYEQRILDSVLVPVCNVRLQDDTIVTYWREYKKDGVVIDHELGTKALNAPQALGEWLSNRLIPVARNHTIAMLDYMHALFASTMGSQPHLPQYTHFGWIKAASEIRNGKEYPGETGFVIGEQVYWPNKAPMKAVLAPDVAPIAKWFAAEGSRDAWKRILTVLQSRTAPDMRWARTIICAYFGSVLAKYLGNTDGLPLVYIYTKNPGIGKTTLMNLGSSLYGSPQLIKFTPATPMRTRLAIISAMHNIPSANDELTHTGHDHMEEFLMELSQGKEKMRLKNTGTYSEVSGRQWETIAFSTGNVARAQLIANTSTLDLPLLSRLIQVDLDHLPKTEAIDYVSKEILDLKDTNFGLIGRDWIQYLLDNFEKVVPRVQAFRQNTKADFGELQSERIWGNFYTLVKSGCEIGREAGVHPFEWSDIKPELDRWISEMRVHSGAAVAKSADWFNMLIQQLAQRTLVVAQHAKPSPAQAKTGGYVKSPPLYGNSPAARIALEDKIMFVPVPEIQTFAKVNKLDYEQLRSAWTEQGILKSTGVMVRLGAHVPEYVSKQGRCYEFDVSTCLDYVQENIIHEQD